MSTAEAFLAPASGLPRPPGPAHHSPGSPSLALHAAVGAAQGLALWLLYETLQRGLWPAGHRPWSVALIAATLAAPLAWQLSHGGFATARARGGFAALVGLLYAGLGAHAARAGEPQASWTPEASQLLAALVLGFVLVPLVGGFDASRRRFSYLRLFELAWRNAVLLPAAGTLAGLLWILLFAAAWLMESIGLGALRELLGQRVFHMPVTGAALGLAFGLGLARAELLVALRRFWLSVTTWFLPLALGFALVWVAALPWTGVQPLFATRSAAFYLLWFGVLAVSFVNAAYQDGSEPPVYPPPLAALTGWAWLSMPVLAALAGWALWQRVAQHGWTPDRIWAGLAWLLVTIHVTGYALSLRRRQRWMHAVAATNIVAALVLVLAIVALISPLADARRLATADQVARLLRGAIDPGDFDWQFLRRHAGPYGLAALDRLAAAPGPDERGRQIALRAAEVRSEEETRAHEQAQDRDRALAALRERIVVKPAGAMPDAALLDWLARPQADWDERQCLAQPRHCALWLTDLDRDGTPEAVLLWERGRQVQATLYGREAGGWRKQGTLSGRGHSLEDWLAGIDAGRIRPLPPQWPDLAFDGERLRLGR